MLSSTQNGSLPKLRQGLLSAFLTSRLLVCLFLAGEEEWRKEEGPQRVKGGPKLQAGEDLKTGLASAE